MAAQPRRHRIRVELVELDELGPLLVADLASLLQDLVALHDTIALAPIQTARGPVPPESSAPGSRRLARGVSLELRRIQLGSPGVIELVTAIAAAVPAIAGAFGALRRRRPSPRPTEQQQPLPTPPPQRSPPPTREEMLSRLDAPTRRKFDELGITDLVVNQMLRLAEDGREANLEVLHITLRDGLDISRGLT